MHPSSSRVIPERAEQERAKQVEFEFGAYATKRCGKMKMCVVVIPTLSASALQENVEKWAVKHKEGKSCLLALWPQQVAAPEAVGRRWPVVFRNMISLQWEPREKGGEKRKAQSWGADSGCLMLFYFFALLPSHSQFLAVKWMDRFPMRSSPLAAQPCWGKKEWGRSLW